MEVADEMKDKQSGLIGIWIEYRYSSALTQLGKLENNSSDNKNKNVIYIITRETKTIGSYYTDIIEPIKKMHCIDQTDIQRISIESPKSDIELSAREVSVDVT